MDIKILNLRRLFVIALEVDYKDPKNAKDVKVNFLFFLFTKFFVLK